MSEPHRATLTHHPDFLAYDFGPQHPLRPERITRGLDLLAEAGLRHLQHGRASRPSMDRAGLETVHAAEYIRSVEEASAGKLPPRELILYGLGPGDTPAFSGAHEAATAISGGTVQAARDIVAGRVDHAFNPSGGWHHALRARASGFCIYNDAAIAAAILSREHEMRVLYVDFDCHHGDGVQWLFYDDPRVLTVSFHESGRYLFPGTGDPSETGQDAGIGFAINVPMAPYTRDESWLEAVHSVLPDVTERFRPDVIISNHGADTHLWDPITHIALTTRAFAQQARLVHALSHEYAGGRWLAVGSGGYEWRDVVPRSWSIVWAEMSGQTLPERIPAAWRDRWDPDGMFRLSESFLDPEGVSPPTDRDAEITAINRRTLAAVRSLHGLSSSVI
jgi:acetoin utilization protein AcuC